MWSAIALIQSTVAQFCCFVAITIQVRFGLFLTSCQSYSNDIVKLPIWIEFRFVSDVSSNLQQRYCLATKLNWVSFCFWHLVKLTATILFSYQSELSFIFFLRLVKLTATILFSYQSELSFVLFLTIWRLVKLTSTTLFSYQSELSFALFLTSRQTYSNDIV